MEVQKKIIAWVLCSDVRKNSITQKYFPSYRHGKLPFGITSHVHSLTTALSYIHYTVINRKLSCLDCKTWHYIFSPCLYPTGGQYGEVLHEYAGIFHSTRNSLQVEAVLLLLTVPIKFHRMTITKAIALPMQWRSQPCLFHRNCNSIWTQCMGGV